MDSSTTLVNPAPPTSYFFSSSSEKHATIYSHPAVPLYTIASTGKQTRIKDCCTPGRTVAIFHEREILPNTISFPERKGSASITMQKWLRRTKLTDGSVAYVMNTDYGRFVWRIVSRHCQMVYAEYDMNRPIASCSLYPTLPHGIPAFTLQYDAEPLRDEILVAYLLQRQRLISEDMIIELFMGSSV